MNAPFMGRHSVLELDLEIQLKSDYCKWSLGHFILSFLGALSGNETEESWLIKGFEWELDLE